MRRLFVIGKRPVQQTDFKITYSECGYAVQKYKAEPGNNHLLNIVIQDDDSFVGWYRTESKEMALARFQTELRRLLGLKTNFLK